MRRAAIFTRVSTDRQTTENQLQRLREVAERAGWHLVDVYEEVVSGAAARGRRAAYDRMLKDATRRRFEVLLAWDVSRLGRSLRELLECFETLRRTGVDLYLPARGRHNDAGGSCAVRHGWRVRRVRALDADRADACRARTSPRSGKAPRSSAASRQRIPGATTLE